MLRGGFLDETSARDVVKAELLAKVRAEIGPWAALREVVIVKRLPKTRSGKILRNIIRAISNGSAYKLPGTIENKEVVNEVEEALRECGIPELKSEP